MLRMAGCPECQQVTSGDCGRHGDMIVEATKSMTAPMPVRPTAGSRSALLLAEITKQITDRRASIDGAADLAQITITVKLNAGTIRVRGVVWEEERVSMTRVTYGGV